VALGNPVSHTEVNKPKIISPVIKEKTQLRVYECVKERFVLIIVS